MPSESFVLLLNMCTTDSFNMCEEGMSESSTQRGCTACSDSHVVKLPGQCAAGTWAQVVHSQAAWQ